MQRAVFELSIVICCSGVDFGFGSGAGSGSDSDSGSDSGSYSDYSSFFLQYILRISAVVVYPGG